MIPPKNTGSFRMFEALYLSFYSRQFYQEIARNRKDLCFAYLFFILMMFWIPEMMNWHRSVSDFVSDEAPAYVEQFPVITISKGAASIKEPVPYTIFDKKNNRPFVIIDTSGTVTSLDKSPAYMLLTNNMMLLKNDRETRSLSLADIGDLVINRALIYNWLEIFNNLFVGLLFPVMLLISFGFHLIQVILLSFIGGNLAKYFDANLDSRALIRLSVVAFTPAILLETVHAVFDIQYPYSSFLSFLITAGYLFYAIGANAEKVLTPIDRK